MKRLISIILSTILIGGLLAGCSGTTDTSKSASVSSSVSSSDNKGVNTEISGKIVVLMLDLPEKDGINPSTLKEVKSYIPIFAKFNELYPNVTVEIISVPTAESVMKAQAMLVSKTVDVVFNMDQLTYAENLAPYMTRDEAELTDLSCTPKSLYNTWDSQVVVSMPLKAKIFAMYYDKQLFDDYGVEYLSDIPDWQEIMEKAKLFVGPNPRTGKTTYGFWKCYSGDPQDVVANYLSRVNSKEVVFDITGPGFNDLKYKFTTDQKWKDTMQYYKDIFVYADPGSKDYVGYDKFGTEENDIAIIQISWTDGIIMQSEAGGTSRIEGKENRIGFTDFPRNIDGKFPMYHSGSFGLGMSKDCQNKEAAWAFIKWCATDVGVSVYLFDTLGYIPVNFAGLEATGMKKSYPDIAKIMEVQPKDYFLTYAPPQGLEAVIDKYCSLYWNGIMTLDEACKTMQDEAQAIVDAAAKN